MPPVRSFSPDDSPPPPPPDLLDEHLEGAEADDFERERWKEDFEENYPDASEKQVDAAWDAFDAQHTNDASSREPINAIGGPSRSVPAGYLREQEKTSTGTPVGRPRRGTNDQAKIGELIVERAEGISLDELRESLGRGRPSGEQKANRETTAGIIRSLRSDSLATVDGLAKALNCSERTIEHLTK